MVRKEKKSKDRRILKTRRSFSIQFKLAIINHCEKKKNITATADLFNVHKDCIRHWQKKKDELKAAHSKSVFLF
jgi:transposase-like protein